MWPGSSLCSAVFPVTLGVWSPTAGGKRGEIKHKEPGSGSYLGPVMRCSFTITL